MHHRFMTSIYPPDCAIYPCAFYQSAARNSEISMRRQRRAYLARPWSRMLGIIVGEMTAARNVGGGVRVSDRDNCPRGERERRRVDASVC